MSLYVRVEELVVMVGGCEVVITHTGHTESTYSEYQNTIHCVQRSEIVEQRLWCSQPWAPFAWEWSCKLRCLSSLIHWSLPFSYTYSSSVWKSDNPTSHHSSPSQPWRPALFAPPPFAPSSCVVHSMLNEVDLGDCARTITCPLKLLVSWFIDDAWDY